MDKNTDDNEIQVEPPVISAIGLTIQETAAALRIHPRSVFALIEKQGLPARKVAGGWRIEQGALRQWLAEGREKPVKYNLGNKEPKSEQEAKEQVKIRRTRMPAGQKRQE